MDAINKLPQVGINAVIIHTIIFEIDPIASKFCEAIHQQVGYPGPVQSAGSVDNMARIVKELCHHIQDTNHQFFGALVVILTGTPCQSISRAATRAANRVRFGLHAEPSNTWFKVHEAIHSIACHLHPAQYMVFCENVVPAMIEDLQILDSTAGFRKTMTTRYQGLVRQRYCWTSLKFVPWDTNPVPMRLPEGWTFLNSKAPPSPRAVFPWLLQRALFNFDQLPEADQQTVKSMRMLFHGKVYLPSIEVWAILVGLPPSIITTLTKTSPCEEWFQATPGWRQSPEDFRCGRSAYCGPCSRILHHLGEAWHLDTTTAFVGGCLEAFLRMHSGFFALKDPFGIPWGVQIYDRFAFKYNISPHQCTASCTLARGKMI